MAICDHSQPFGCPAGSAAYFGRGPAQLSWNYNYKWAGDALGMDLLDDPSLVARDSSVAWKTAVWFWNTQGAHKAMVSGRGFGDTIRVFDGRLECDGHNPAEVGNRVRGYLQMAALLGVTAGDNLSC